MSKRVRWWIGAVPLSIGCAILLVAGCGDAGEARDAPIAERANVELVGPGVISLPERHETFPAEDPVTGDLWFSVYEDSFDEQTIMVARRSDDGWTDAVVAPFSGQFGDRAPRFAPDGSALFFTSNRPAAELPDGDMNVWRVQRTGTEWSAPSLVPAPVSSSARDIHPSVTDAATWVASSRDGSLGRSDIFRVASDGTVTHPPAPINDELSQPDLWVSPDETWMILVITEHPEGLGGDDLFVLHRAEGSWGPLQHAGAPLNSDEYEYGPTLSADGRHIYFTSHRVGTADVYRAPVERFRDIGR